MLENKMQIYYCCPGVYIKAIQNTHELSAFWYFYQLPTFLSLSLGLNVLLGCLDDLSNDIHDQTEALGRLACEQQAVQHVEQLDG